MSRDQDLSLQNDTTAENQKKQNDRHLSLSLYKK